MYRTLSAPLMVQWEVTPSCNHNCVHCYNHWRTKEEVASRITCNDVTNRKIVAEMISHKVFALNITGGEPLLVIKQISPLLETLSGNNVQVAMNSNLTLLTRETAQLLKECGVKSILVSVPSGDKNTCDLITGRSNSLKQIARGISLAQKVGIRLFANMVVSRMNKGQIEKTAEFVRSLGIKHFAASRASDPSEGKEFTSEILGREEFQRMQEDLENAGDRFGLKINSIETNPACAYGESIPRQGYKFCSAGKTTCTIGFDGMIRPCNRVNLPYGNISDGLLNCWLKMEDWRTDKWIPKECSSCRLKSVCGGGCKADAIRAFGDITMPDPLRTDTPIPQTPAVRITERSIYDSPLYINPSLLRRSEKFGSILFLSLSQWVAVNHELSALLQKKELLSVNDITRALSITENDACATIAVLVKKGVLSKNRKGVIPSGGQC